MVRRKINHSQESGSSQDGNTGDPTVKVTDFLSDLLTANPGLEALKEALTYVVNCEEQLSATLERQQAAYLKIVQWQLRLLEEILAKSQESETRQMTSNVNNSIEATLFLHSEAVNDSQSVDILATPEISEQKSKRDGILSPEMNHPSRSLDKPGNLGSKAATIQDDSLIYDGDLPAEAWILDTWLRFPFDGQCDIQAEKLFEEGKLQQGIIHIDRILESNMSPECTINTMLLQSCALRNCEYAQEGLTYTERAVRLADKENMSALLCKAQFYRGLCLYDLGFYRDAIWCFIFARGLVKFGHLLRQYTKLTDQKRKTLPLDDRRRRTSKGFRAIPLGD